MRHKVKIFGEAFDGPQQEAIGEAITATTYSLKFRPAASGLHAIQLGWTGTLTGTFSLQYTALEYPSDSADTNWDSDADWATAASDPAGAPGTTFVPTTFASGGWYRVKYTHTSGTGNMWGIVRFGDGV